MTVSTATCTIHPNKRNFVEGLYLIFDRWVAFKMALELQWGGYDSIKKAEEFKIALIDYFEREGKSIEREDLEDILLDVMCREFSTVLEDESEIEVSKSILTLYKESINGKVDFLNLLRERASKPVPLNVIKGQSLSSEEGNTDADTDTDTGNDDNNAGDNGKEQSEMELL